MNRRTKIEIPSCENCENKSGLLCSLPHTNKTIISKGKGGNFYRKGQVIFYEDNYVNGLYCIHQGKVKLSKLGESGKEQIVRFAKTGDILGYRSLLSNESYKATATAMEDSHICIISKDKFKEAMIENPKLSFGVLELLSNDLKSAEQKLINLSQKTVLERLAEALIVLENCFGTTKNQTLDINLTRSELADIVGTTTETAIRSLATLNEEGIVELEGKKIKIVNRKRLFQLSGITD